MNDWKVKKFTSLIEINPSLKADTQQQYEYIEMKDLSPGFRWVYPSDYRKLKGGARFEEGDTLFARITPCLENGKICQVKNLRQNTGFGSTEFLVFRNIEDVSHKDFVYYLASSPLIRKFAENKMVGTSGRQRVNKDVFENLEIPLPPLPTQHRIAEILGALDDKIELNLQMNKTLEEMAMRLYKHWFVDCPEKTQIPVENYITLNPRLSLQKRVVAKHVEMKAIPENESGVRYYSFREFKGGAKFQNNDTIFARITPCLENGKTAFVDFLDQNEVGFGSTEFLIMRAKDKVSPFWVYCLARDNAFRKHAISTMVGTSGRQRVQNKPLLDYQVMDIDSREMDRFSSKVKPYFGLIRNNNVENDTLVKTRDYLLPKLISGEIEVKTAESTIKEVL